MNGIELQFRFTLCSMNFLQECQDNSVGKSFQQMRLRHLGIHMEKNEVGTLPHTIYKNKLKIDHGITNKN